MGSVGDKNNFKAFAEAKFSNADCVVIKVGSSLVVDNITGLIRERWLETIASDVARLKHDGKKVVIVSSGSIALGRKILGFSPSFLSLEESQAAAAIGQIQLAQAYQKSLESHGIISAQILVTAEDSRDRRRYLNSRATLLKLLEIGAVPIVNENDTVATDEIRFGDNDRLAAQVCSLCDANILILFSDVDGLFEANPNHDRGAQHIPLVEKITENIKNMAYDDNKVTSKGGMRTKIEAAKMAIAAGCHMVITSGEGLNPLQNLINGALATWFISSEDPITARKQWILNTKAKGRVYIDSGAEVALTRGKSLLPAGVESVEGDFERGDTVEILSSDGKFLANGLIDYSDKEVNLIKGNHSSSIESILGHPGRSVLIHRNNMAI